jgi:ribonuclease E
MSKEIYISSTPHETRLAIVEKDELTEIYYERENEYTLAGSIYNGRVTRVLPGMQSSFVDIGLERDAFLYITDFMEEAGESADFENGGEGGRGRNRERARSGGGEPPAAEGEAAAPGREDRSREDRSRERGSRDRGGRDRGRGRRDERPREDRPQGEPSQGEAVEVAPIVSEGFDTEGDTGEGAPGADGGRRWRGRRGRRRGRGNGEESRVPTAASGEEGPASAKDQNFADDLSSEEGVRSGDGYKSAEGYRPTGGDNAGEGATFSNRDGEESTIPPRGDRRERGGKERGRGGVRGRLDAIRERFAPRGARVQDDGVDLDASSAPAVEPFILPGESLGKYRPREEQEAAATKPAVGMLAPVRPSSEVVLSGWDGGATLPGETLRPRSGGGGGNSGSGEFRSRVDKPRHDRPREDRPQADKAHADAPRDERGGREGGGSDRRRERDRGRGRTGGGERQTFVSQRMEPSEAVQPVVTTQHDFDEPQGFQQPQGLHEPQGFSGEMVPQTESAFEQQLETTAQAHHDELRTVEVELEETTSEYEPQNDASASFRVNGTGQRELRQSAPQDDLAEAAFEEVEQHEASPAAFDSAVGAHEFTSLQPTGDMLSEASLEAAPQDAENPASPMQHEAAVQQARLAQASQTLVPPFDLISNPMAFAPGDGALEEELMDEEDELPHLHAGGVDDDVEEETVEGPADLGTLLREMSIEQMTRTEVSSEEDDEDFDIDEEDIEEDAFESGEDELSGSEPGEVEEEELNETSSFEEGADAESRGEGQSAEGQVGDAQSGDREPRARRDGRRGRDRSGRDRGSREGSSREGSNREGASREGASREGGSREGGSTRDRRGMSGSRTGGRGRHSVQAMDLPAISDLLKPGQEVLVQIAKEPIAKKGARITSHIALPGRFLVFMPTVNHTGVSRKIESDAERRRLREILLSEKGEASGGFIVRTAAAGASEEELRSDLRFLLNLWADIKQRSESSKSPALIYHDLNLIERILRDQVTDNFSAIWVDTEAEYERVLRFLQRFQPNLIRRVKLYTKDTPLFEQFGITEEINKALRSKVWLKSGGSIVINQTEALVAIDINTGKFVGKTTKLEDTIVKTNLDAIPEIVRQIRLRDLGGIIIIDFIDMDERKNRNKVMMALEDELKKDRAPSKVLQFNDFGLVAITRKRVKQSLERTLSTTCGVCAGTGMVKSPVTVANDIYVEMRKMHKMIEKGDIMLRVHPEVVKQLKTGGGKWLQEMEEMSGKTILVKSDPALHPEQFDIH